MPEDALLSDLPGLSAGIPGHIKRGMNIYILYLRHSLHNTD